ELAGKLASPRPPAPLAHRLGLPPHRAPARRQTGSPTPPRLPPARKKPPRALELPKKPVRAIWAVRVRARQVAVLKALRAKPKPPARKTAALLLLPKPQAQLKTPANRTPPQTAIPR